MKKIWKTITGRIIIVLVIFIFLAAAVVFLLERRVNTEFKTFSDSLWWAFVTLTTVGYGDKVPVTPGARVASVFLMFIGLGLLSVVTASFSSIFVSQKILEDRGLKKVKLKNHILICGWNHNIFNILKTFVNAATTNEKEIVMVNDEDEAQFTNLKLCFCGISMSFVRGRYSDEQVLHRASIDTAKAAIILGDYGNPNSDQDVILATLTMKSIVPTMRVCVEILNAENIIHIKRARADEIIVTGVHSGFLLANAAIAPGLPRVIEQLIMAESKKKLVKEDIPHRFIGRTFKELFDFFREQGSLLIGTITAESSFKLSDLVSDDTSMIDNFIKEKFAEVENEYFSESTGEMNINLNPSDAYKILPADSAVTIKNSDSTMLHKGDA